MRIVGQKGTHTAVKLSGLPDSRPRGTNSPDKGTTCSGEGYIQNTTAENSRPNGTVGFEAWRPTQVVELSERLASFEERQAQLEEAVMIEREGRTRVESENAQLLAALTEEQRLRESHDERIARLQDELALAQLAREAALGQVSAASGR